MRARSPVVAMAILLAAACGSDRGTAPSPPRPAPSPSPRGLAAGAAVSVVRGDTGAPVPGAVVTVAGRAYTADAAGAVRIDEAAGPGASVDVTAPVAFDRQTSVAGTPLSRYVLWPRTTASGLTEDFTRSIVYTSGSPQGGPPGGEPLRRLSNDLRTAVLVVSAEILDDPVAHAFQLEAAADVTAATRGAVQYVVAREPPPSGVFFDVRVAPDDPGCVERVRAFTRVATRSLEIVGGGIVYCSWDAARSTTVVHELGHTTGLVHSNDFRDVMYGTFVRGRSPQFSAREGEILALMRERRAGNRFPDSDRDLPASNALDTSVVVCR